MKQLICRMGVFICLSVCMVLCLPPGAAAQEDLYSFELTTDAAEYDTSSEIVFIITNTGDGPIYPHTMPMEWWIYPEESGTPIYHEGDWPWDLNFGGLDYADMELPPGGSTDWEWRITSEVRDQLRIDGVYEYGRYYVEAVIEVDQWSPDSPPMSYTSDVFTILQSPVEFVIYTDSDFYYSDETMSVALVNLGTETVDFSRGWLQILIEGDLHTSYYHAPLGAFENAAEPDETIFIDVELSDLDLEPKDGYYIRMVIDRGGESLFWTSDYFRVEVDSSGWEENVEDDKWDSKVDPTTPSTSVDKPDNWEPEATAPDSFVPPPGIE